MFFQQFWIWLNDQLTEYLAAKTATVAGSIEPAVVTLATIYVMLWGFLSLTGRVQEPIWEGVKRILFIAIVLGCGLRLWLYSGVIVDTFFNAPIQLAAKITGASNPVAVIDTIWDKGGTVASNLWNKGGVLNGDFGFYLAGAIVYFIIGGVAVYTLFLLVLSKLALALIIALGPIFICLLFFEATRRFFEAWIAQLTNYALVAVLTSLVASLMLQIVSSYAAQTAARGAAIMTVDALNMVLCASLVLLVMRQIMSIAAGLASGIALSSFGLASGLARWAMGGAKRTSYEFGRGVLDGLRREPGSRWDSFRRLAGNRVGAGVASMTSVGAARRGGTVLPREQVMPGLSRKH
ncbi:type IV secretion system protein [Variovorax boronicumulans]|uniref:type IV secretion system protein n=1 Tax=Variovorax boronicumulans TaxID=436515 RepID=UPI00278B2FB9|nr:type IV secretion system protein [Variovorax boronicumulans]MDQ0044316.1 type IV secretion system protein VirB6 [Variovorax boronicumulans]